MNESRQNFSNRQKVVLITGVAEGLGKSLAQVFGNMGFIIAGVDINGKSLSNLRGELERLEITHLIKEADITNESQIFATIENLIQELGRLDILINNAGITVINTFDQTSPSNFKRVIEVNLMGSVFCTYAALPYIIAQKGTIAFISSVAGFAPVYGRTAYCASKHGLEGFAKTLRTELAGKGVHVSLISPATINTGIRKKYSKDATIGKVWDQQQRIGDTSDPMEVATHISKQIIKKKKRILYGRLSYISFWVVKFFPTLYDRVMTYMVEKKMEN